MVSTKQLTKELEKRRKAEAKRVKRKALKSEIRKLKYRRVIKAGKITGKAAKVVGKVAIGSTKGFGQIGQNINQAQIQAERRRRKKTKKTKRPSNEDPLMDMIQNL